MVHNMTSIQPVIICGGAGERLWPLSRAGFPKQFLCLTGQTSLFQEAAKRMMLLEGDALSIASPLVVTGEEHRFVASEQLREIGAEPRAMLLEPVGKNTAPALTLAALAAIESGDDPILVVTPADQAIGNAPRFVSAVNHAIRDALAGHIVILGVPPNRIETGYGYIQATDRSAPTFIVDRFVEKPDTEAALQYTKEGNYYWNAGIVVLKASVWLKALECFSPIIATTTRAAWDARSSDITFIRPSAVEFSAIPSNSIDYAVLEQCPGSSFPIRMVLLDAGWSDLGSWDSVWKELSKDQSGNAHIGDVFSIESSNTLVMASNRLVTLIGVQNLVVVETPDAILVADKTHSRKVKEIISQLQLQNREECTLHRKVHRPWGWYDGIDQGARFKVKRIQVKPGESLSLQKHDCRAEHWVVVQGIAEITCGDKKLQLVENQSTYIPLGEVHRLANPGSTPLEIIEVQSGSYLGEDDIVRYEDHYGRSLK
jgi:mannose-1-phosphate guanylyltransferase/mannose-6-phosphate isomerase